jgi:hypothetical protein
MDPIGFEAGDANLYRYVGNGATNLVDASGLFEINIQGRGGDNNWNFNLNIGDGKPLCWF